MMYCMHLLESKNQPILACVDYESLNVSYLQFIFNLKLSSPALQAHSAATVNNKYNSLEKEKGYSYVAAFLAGLHRHTPQQ